MISIPVRPSTPWLSIVGFLLGMAGIAASIALTQVGLTGLTGASAGEGSPNLVAELERLTALHQSGSLTDEEFAAAKHNLIEKGG